MYYLTCTCYTPLMNNNGAIKIFYQIAADFVFLLHLILVCIVAVGWLIPGFFYVHLILLLATFLSEIFLGFCPLTTLEFGIRKKLDPSLLFDKSCMVHYLRKWRGLGPRPLVSNKSSFFKKNSFIFILLILGILSFAYRFFI